MLPDLPGTMLAMLAFALVAIAPGWAVGYWFDLLCFRSRFVTFKLAIALAMSLAIAPILLVLIVRFANLRAGAATMLLFDLLAIAAIVHGAMRSRRRSRPKRSSRFITERRRSLRITGIVAIVWMLIALLILLDVIIGDRLYMSVPWMDNTKRASWIDAIVRTGVPPNNPSTYPGRPIKLFYYYGWYTWAAVAQTLAPGHVVRPVHTLIAGVIWTGWAFIGSIALAVQYLGGVARRRLRGYWITATLLLAVTGLDILPCMLRLYTFLTTATNNRGAPRTGEWWNEQVTGFIDMPLWVPHHVSGTIAGLVALCLLRWMYPGSAQNADEPRAMDNRPGNLRIVGSIVMAIALASLSALSLYVALPLGVFLFAYAIVCLMKGRAAEAGTLALVGVLAGLIASPYLYDLLTAPGATSGITIAVREFTPASSVLNSRAVNPDIISVVNFFLLPLNYFLELGFFLVAGAVYWLWRRKERRPADRFAAGLLLASILVATFLKSSIAGNDLGWRSIVWAQVVLLVWSIEPASAMWSGIFDSRTVSPRTDELPDRFPRTISLIVLLAALGIGSTLYDLFLLRFSFQIWPEKEIEPARMLAMRRAYEWIDRNLPPDCVVQHNTNIALDLFAGHYGNRQVAVSDTQITVAQGMSRDEFTKLINRIYDPFMLPRSPATVKRMATDLGIDYLFARDVDDAWKRKDSWMWTQPTIYTNENVRVFAVKDLAEQ